MEHTAFGALEITANFTQDLFDIWDEMVDAYELAVKDGMRTWLCFDIPNFDKAVFIPVQPARMGVPETSANALLETTVFITPIGEPQFETAPTYTDTALLGN